MTRIRRRFSSAFKAKVALATARGDKTTAELAGQFRVHANQVQSTCRRRLFTAGGKRCIVSCALSQLTIGVMVRSRTRQSLARTGDAPKPDDLGYPRTKT